MKASVLETKRLKLIPLSTLFCQQYYVDWLNDSEVFKHLESGGNYTIEMLHAYLQKVERSDIYFWAILIKDSNKHIGNIKIDPIDQEGNGEYGIMMGDTNEWGQGYAKEVSQRIIEECFQNMGLKKITLGFVEANIAAHKLYLSLGFKQMGVPQKKLRANGMQENAIRMELLRDNWHHGKKTGIGYRSDGDPLRN